MFKLSGYRSISSASRYGWWPVSHRGARKSGRLETFRGRYFLPLGDRFPQFYRNKRGRIVSIVSQVWLATGCVNACGSRSRRCVHLVIVDGALTPWRYNERPALSTPSSFLKTTLPSAFPRGLCSKIPWGSGDWVRSNPESYEFMASYPSL